MSKKPWFEVDRDGLAEIVQRRGGLAWLVQELISNGWDETGVTRVDVTLSPVENSPMVELTVIDDAPNGFQDLSHAWTLFAKSAKRGNAELRGRFNLGEKLVLAFCKEASITTTTGSVIFDHRGRVNGRSKRNHGSEFFGVVRMTREQLAQALVDLQRLIPPDGITTTINGAPLEARKPFHSFRECLWTEVPDDETGALCRRVRHADIRVFEPKPNEQPMLYELGIPVVPLDGDPFHVDVRQKVPLNLERDNVTPNYLRDVRAAVLSNTHKLMTPEALRGAWATDAMSHPLSRGEAVKATLDARFGDKRVTADPSDREAENKLKAQGYTVVHGGSLPAEAWERVRELGLMQSAGQLAPTPKPYDDDGDPPNCVTFESRDATTRDGILRYRAVCRLLLGVEPKIVLVDEPSWHCLAVWHAGKKQLVLNVGRLDVDHFASRVEVYKLALHEIAHETEGNHLDEKYHDELCRLGAKLVVTGEEAIDKQVETYREQWLRSAS